MPILIYHNPDCGTSRNTLAIIKAFVETPEIIEYLKDLPSRARLIQLLEAMAMPAICCVARAHPTTNSDWTTQG